VSEDQNNRQTTKAEMKKLIDRQYKLVSEFMAIRKRVAEIQEELRDVLSSNPPPQFLSVRARNALTRDLNLPHSWDERDPEIAHRIAAMTEAELLRTPELGRVGLRQIRDWLDSYHNLKLGPP
jgi:hypothetical protein